MVWKKTVPNPWNGTKKLADLGDTTSMRDIANMYEYGEGVKQDYAKALEWYEKAAELGDEDAKKSAEDIRKYLQ